MIEHFGCVYFLISHLLQLTDLNFFMPSHADSSGFGSQSNHDNRLTGEIVGIVVGGAGALLILSFVFYLWWKKDARGHIRVDTDSPRKA